MTTGIGGAYDLSADAWRRGPEAFYARLAGALLDAAPTGLAGATVLDAGAGTGVAGAQALARGATRVVAVDLATRMLPRPPALAVGGDLVRLPFRDATFDLTVAAFSLSHVPDPERAVAELRRVAGGLLVSAFRAGWTHPAKDVVEQALVRRGYRPPPWYVALKAGPEARLGDPQTLAEVAVAAGHRSVRVRCLEVDGGLDSPGAVVSWRLGMAHTAPFVAGLPAAVLAEIQKEAEDALVGAASVVVPMLVLTAS